jgi:hypothetical protein
MLIIGIGCDCGMSSASGVVEIDGDPAKATHAEWSNDQISGNPLSPLALVVVSYGCTCQIALSQIPTVSPFGSPLWGLGWKLKH